MPRKWIVIISLIMIVLGGAVAATTAGWIKPGELMAKLPAVGKLVRPASRSSDTTGVAALKRENQNLKKQVAALQNQLSQKLTQQLQQPTATGGSTPAGTNPGGSQPLDLTKNYRALADSYSSMDPAKAANIMKNLTPQLEVEILRAMDRDQAGQILAAMDPAQAARLTELLATTSPPAAPTRPGVIP